MNGKKALVLAGMVGLGFGMSAQAQATNEIRAAIEIFEAQTNVLLVKGVGVGGSVNFGSGVMSVRLKDTFSPDNGQRLQGLVLTYTEGDRRERATVDYEEIDPLLKAIDYVRSASYDVTGLPSFEVEYRTRDGLRIIGLGSRRQSSVEDFVQFDDGDRIPLNSDQIMQLRGIISQARTALDNLRPAK